MFDIRTQGYDAILNNVSTYNSGEVGEAPAADEYRVIVSIYYNIEFEELLELANEAGVKPADLFDSIGITGIPKGGGDPFEANYECA